MVISLGGKSEKITYCNLHTHHNEWEIIQIRTGENRSIVDGETYDAKPGDIMVIPPDVPHGSTAEGIFTDMYFRADNMDFSVVTVVHDYDNAVRPLFDMLIKVCTEKETDWQPISSCLGEAICTYIKKYAKTDYKYPFVTDIKNKMYEELSNPNFNISDEVRKIGYNTDYFRRCFREELGLTPLEYLTKLRIDEAGRLLTQRTFQSVEKVSRQCGFSDYYYFSKLFKKQTGLSPKNYRKKYTKH